MLPQTHGANHGPKKAHRFFPIVFPIPYHGLGEVCASVGEKKNAVVIRNACVQSIEVQCVNFNHADVQSMVFFLNFEHEAFLLVQL